MRIRPWNPLLLLSWLLPLAARVASASPNISAIWANDGGDKVTQDELRASRKTGKVTNKVWDGHKISIFGSRNEVVSFNVILEAADARANNVIASFNKV